MKSTAIMAGTLYTYPENFRAFKALIAAQYSGAKVTVANDFKLGETNKSPEFLKKFPLGKVPAFEGADGTWLFESNAIAHYVGTEALRGKTPADQARVQQWVNFADQEILPASCTWVFPTMGIMQYNKQNTERAKEEVQRALSALNEHLLTRTYLVGERISLADICVMCNLLALYQHVMDPAFRAPYVNVTRWFMTLVNQPQCKAVLGEIKLCETMAQFDAKKFAELQGKGEKKEKAPAKPKQEQAKKAPAPKKEEKPAEEEEEQEAPKKPSNDPFLAFPVGNWNMEEWKRYFSNHEDEEVLKYFWEKIEPENYSFWRGDYKYNDELKVPFMASNLMGGMMQRLDRLHKHGFGSLCLFGEPGNMKITHFWFWRGQELAFDLSDDLNVDAPTYEWKKLDPRAPENKDFIEGFLKHEWKDGKFEGLALNTGKIFK